ncbi:MAG: HD domain-containing protein [Deltaproteobacteria bacterium]|jgi:putative two-component system response regulator|nr:HD domain-containing protein [Deltaproteobacteria bacterium]
MKGWVKDGQVILAGLTATEVARAETAFAGLFEVVTVQDASCLFRALEARVPAVIVIDIEKPSMEAPETLKRIWADPAMEEVTVIQAAGSAADLIDTPGPPPAWACFVSRPVTGVPLLEKVWVLTKLEGYRAEAKARGRELEDARREISALRDELARLRGACALPQGAERDAGGTGDGDAAGSGAGRVARLQASLLTTVTSLVEFRDDVTGGHITRTMRWLELLLEGLEELGMYSEETGTWDRETVLQSSKLHDVGKIAISDAILKKPSQLTPEEYEEMKRHAALGGEIIDGIQASLPESDAVFMEHARLLAVGHHEKWDGTGYPLGLSGTGISLQGRLMAVTDVYDALVSRRPYKNPMPHAKALEIIRDGSGTHFDPVIAEVFVMFEGRFRESLERLMG